MRPTVSSKVRITIAGVPASTAEMANHPKTIDKKMGAWRGAPTIMFFKRKKIALALGGGSARGLANIGVLRALEDAFGRDKMPFDMVVGTSIGSLIGAAYCIGVTPSILEEKARKFGWQELVDLGLYPTGLIKGDKLESLIVDVLDSKGFSDVKVPFALMTTDVESGEELIHTSGDLAKLVRASCSWPGIFSAVKMEGRLLVDGGVRNSVPTKAAHALGADVIIAVDPGFAVTGNKLTNVLHFLVQGVQIMGEELNSYQAGRADVVIKPELHGVDQFDFAQAPFVIAQGKNAAVQKIDEIKRKLFFCGRGCRRKV